MKMLMKLQEPYQEHLLQVFRIIYEHKEVSRAQLAKITNLTKPTISSLVEQLISAGVVVETGIASTGNRGRHPMILEINPQGGYVVIVMIGRRTITIEVTDLKCQVIYSEEVTRDQKDGVSGIVIEKIEKALAHLSIETRRVMGISICISGIIDFQTRRVFVRMQSDTQELDEMSFEPVCERFADIPIALYHKSAFGAYSEKCRMAKPPQSMMYLVEDEVMGLGCAILINGEPYLGSGNAGELGHMSIDLNGDDCYCGGKGCLERYVEVPTIIRRIKEELANGIRSSLTDMCHGDLSQLTINHVTQAYRDHDPLTHVVMRDIASIMACGLVNCLNVLCPECIILAGVLPDFGDEFLETIKRHMRNSWFQNNLMTPEIRYAHNNHEEIVMGAARYFIDKLINVLGKRL